MKPEDMNADKESQSRTQYAQVPGAENHPLGEEKKSSKKIAGIILGLVVIAVISLGLLVFYKNKDTNTAEDAAVSVKSEKQLDNLNLIAIEDVRDVYVYDTGINAFVAVPSNKELSWFANFQKKDDGFVIDYEKLKTEIIEKYFGDYTRAEETAEEKSLNERRHYSYTKDGIICNLVIYEEGNLGKGLTNNGYSSGWVEIKCVKNDEVAAMGQTMKPFYEDFKKGASYESRKQSYNENSDYWGPGSDYDRDLLIVIYRVEESAIKGYERAYGSITSIRDWQNNGINFARAKGGQWEVVYTGDEAVSCVDLKTDVARKAYADVKCYFEEVTPAEYYNL